MPRNQRTLKWKEFPSFLSSIQFSLYEESKDFDVLIIGSDGNQLKAHRAVLSMCSEFLHSILLNVPAEIIPTIHIPDIDSMILDTIFMFVYTGEVFIAPESMDKFTEACDFLRIDCFTDNKVTIHQINSDRNESSDLFAGNIEESSKAFMLLDNDEQNVEETDDFAIEYLEFDDGSEQYMEDGAIQHDVEYVPGEENASLEISSEGNDDSLENTEEISKSPRKLRQSNRRSKNSTIESVLSEISKGKTINQLSIEHNLPRSTLYHRLCKDENLKQNYRSERRSALDQAVRSVMEERMSLKKASDRFKLPKTAIWRELRKYHQYKPPEREVPQERIEAQNEIMSGKSLTSISMKYGIPLTTLHRDKKRLSSEGKLPDSYRCKDRKEKTEFSQRLEQALQKCQQGMSQYQAAKMYNIPKATMWRYAHSLLKNGPIKSTVNDRSEALQIEMVED